MKSSICILLSGFLFLALACKKDNQTDPNGSSEAQIQFKFKFDPSQERLNSLGQPTALPNGHAAQSPSFRSMSAHYIELVEDEWTPLKSGLQVYQGAEVAANNPNPFNFTTAIDFDKAIVEGEDKVFLQLPIKDLKPGTYRHIRVSVTFQSYDVNYNLINIPQVPDLKNQKGTIASFVGFNTYINQLLVRNQTLDVNQAQLQGFWAFETALDAPYNSFNQTSMGQAPANATTVVNPFPNSPIPPGSCLVSGNIEPPLVITGNEQEDLNIDLSFSINNSFEWIDNNGNGEWDINVSQPTSSEAVVDMGLRGLIGKWSQ